MPQTDPSGRILRPDRSAAPSSQGGAPRIIAVPPVRDVPSEDAVEFYWIGFLSAAVNPNFVALPCLWPFLASGLWPTIGSTRRGRIDAVLFDCGDMVAATNLYLKFRLFVNNALVPGFEQMWVPPRSGTVAISFPASIDLQPNAQFSAQLENADPTLATHNVTLYVHGWTWDKTLVQA